MIINIVNKQRGLYIKKRHIVKTISKIINHQYFTTLVLKKFGPHTDLNKLEVMLIFVGDKKIRELNRTYRQKDYVTDVLSFVYLEEMPINSNLSDEHHELGDIVICIPQAVRQANEQGVDLNEEIIRLIIHGIVHLIGYDHERGQKEARQMRMIENKLLKIALY